MSKFLKYALLITAIVTVFALCASAQVYVIDTMDDVSLWTGNGITQETENYKEGTGAIKSESVELLQMQRKFAEPMDLSAYENNGVVSVWVYINDVDIFAARDNSLEFTSSGTCDQLESAVTLDDYWFENGWNHLYFTMGDFASNDADWSAINYIRAYKFTEGSNYWIWDDIKIGFESDFGIGKVKLTDNATLIESFDDPAAFTVDTAAAIEGTGCATASADSEVMIISRAYDTPIDISRAADNGYVYCWIYVKDAASLRTTDGQLELTSSGGCDVNEMGWVLPSLVEFHDGWNEILLPFPDSTDCDLSAVNFMRLYLFTDNPNTIMIDKLMIGVGEDFGIAPETEPPTEAVTEPATVAPTEGDAETTAAEGDVTEAPADSGSSSSSNNTAIYIIIAIAAVIVIVVIIVIVVNSKKKKK